MAAVSTGAHPHVYDSFRPVSFAAFTINALRPGYLYTGPSGADDSNRCCSASVILTYSLISAYDACQGADWTRYGSLVLFLIPRGRLHISHNLAGIFVQLRRMSCCRELPLLPVPYFRVDTKSP